MWGYSQAIKSSVRGLLVSALGSAIQVILNDELDCVFVKEDELIF
jgi:hypothetical protein